MTRATISLSGELVLAWNFSLCSRQRNGTWQTQTQRISPCPLLWGTCLGLELLTVLTAKKWNLANTDSENLTLPLTLAAGYEDSRIFENMPNNILNYLRWEPVTQNNHQYSILVKDFKAISELSNFYKILATNHGRDNLEFVSLMEAYHYPIYASQWHPEKNVFKWSTGKAVNHDFHAIRVTQYMANFFVNEARKNNHHFDSPDEEAKEMIENDLRVFIPDHEFSEEYYFNDTQTRSSLLAV
ncbi:hypothetical protein EGW08_008546 [Elysia chlorotica]|uniref:folate gamma-glutamyl hydrolase n=1 Tax=Elysia chlorotica TaxID=188477 RepID=A0A433TQ57_ELYCH|nr:hypothetical protein EGW08_008546 [Elysia chlorotica]